MFNGSILMDISHLSNYSFAAGILHAKPEPSSVALIALGLAALGFTKVRKGKQEYC